MTSWAVDRMDLEVYGVDSSLYHKYWDQGIGHWSAFENLGGKFIFSPAAITIGPNKLHLFGIGFDSALYHKYYDPTGWSPSVDGWTSLGGVCMTPPVVVKYGKEDCAAFVIGTDRACWVAMGTGPSTFKWVSLQGKLIGDSITACSWGEGRIDVFGIGTDSALWHTFYTDGKWWGKWESLGGGCIGKPKAVSARYGRIDIFTKGMDSSMYQLCYNGRWQAWQGLGGVHQYEPEAVCWDANRIDVFSVSTDTQLIHIYADIPNNEVGKFGGNWDKLGGNCTGSPKAVARGRNLLDIFVKGTLQQILQKTWTGSAWTPATMFDLSGQSISNPA